MRAHSSEKVVGFYGNIIDVHVFRFWLNLAGVLLICLFIVSCEVAPTKPSSSFSSKTPVEFIDYVPMEPGVLQQISQYFGYEVVAPAGASSHLVIYLLDLESEQKQALAAIPIDGVLVNEYARKSLFAVSWDEKTLLYMHDQSTGPASLRNKPSGLYEYVNGRGDRLIYSDAFIASHSSYQLARNAIEFALGGSNDLKVEHFVRSTEGVEFIQEDAFSFQYGGTGLHRAAAKGDQTRVKELLEYGLEIEARDNRGFTPLHSSIWANQDAMAKLLIENGSDVNEKAKDGSTALHLFSKGVRDERVADWSNSQGSALLLLMLKNGAEVNAQDNAGATPLHYAVLKNNIRTAKILVQNGANAKAMELADSHYYGNKFHHTGSMLVLEQRVNETLESIWWKQGMVE